MRSSLNSLLVFVILIVISSISCKTLNSTLNGVKESVAKVEKDFSKITGNINDISSSIVPIDSLVKDAVNGALDGVTSDKSKAKLDTLAATLSWNIVQYINKALDSLDTAAPAANLVTGLKDSLFAQSTTDEMTKLVTAVFDKSGKELNTIIQDLIANLSSNKTKKRLQGIGNAVVSGITDSLSIKLNQAISQVNFSILGDSIASVLSTKLESRVVEIASNAVGEASNKATEKVNPIIKFAKDNIIKILGTIGLIAAGLIWLAFHFRQKGKKEEAISSILMAEISAAGDHEAIKSLKQNIKRKAEKHKVEDELNNILKTKNLL